MQTPFRRTVALALPAALIAACGDSTEPLVPTSLDVDQRSVTLDVAASVTVQARILDQFGSVLGSIPQGFTITWTGQNTSIAVVDGGVITGVGPGETTVTARAGTLDPAEVEVVVQPRELSGSLSFDYSGDHTGRFDVSSTFRISQAFAPDDPDWVMTFFDGGFDSQDILAQRGRDDGRVDFIWFWVDGRVTTPGVRPPDDGLVVFGFSASPQSAEAIYEVTGGTVNFSSVTGGRLQGSFELSLVASGGRTLEVTGGSFDAPVVSEAELAFSLSSSPLPIAFPNLSKGRAHP